MKCKERRYLYFMDEETEQITQIHRCKVEDPGSEPTLSGPRVQATKKRITHLGVIQGFGHGREVRELEAQSFPPLQDPGLSNPGCRSLTPLHSLFSVSVLVLTLVS